MKYSERQLLKFKEDYNGIYHSFKDSWLTVLEEKGSDSYKVSGIPDSHPVVKEGDLQPIPLSEVFQPHSLENICSSQNGPMASGKGRFYMWYSFYGSNKEEDANELEGILNTHHKWTVGNGSYINYINVTPKFLGYFNSHCISQGPNSSSYNQNIGLLRGMDGNLRIIAEGWGSSFIVIYDGSYKTFLEYMKQNQSFKTIENKG